MVDAQALRGAIYQEYRNIETFCVKTGIARATIDSVLNGKNAPTLTTVEKIMNALHTKTAEQKFHIFFAEELRDA